MFTFQKVLILLFIQKHVKYINIFFYLYHNIAVALSGMERSIHEMLKDAPSLNDSDSAVHSGTPPPHVPNNCNNENQPRPATINLTLGSPISQMCKWDLY